MSFVHLPTELIDAVFERLPQNTLAALSLTSSSLTSCANRQLYRHLSLSSYTNNLEAIHTVASSPELASLVRSFYITLDDSDDVCKDYYITLSKALQNMTELISLQLHVSAEAGWILQNSIPNAKPIIYSRLEDFATSFVFDTHLASFLERTPSLLYLQLSNSFIPSEGVKLSASAMPHLSSYTGPTSLLAQVVPSRPIKSLHLSGDLSSADIELLAQASRAPTTSVRSQGSGHGCETVRVEVLSAITSVAPVLALEALANACPHLVCLRVMTTCAFWEAPDLTFYTRIANTLSTLRSLSAFELSGMHWESRPKSSPSSEDGSISEKEWVSPPVTPRVAEVDVEPLEQDLEFDEAFQEWAY
ncbi:hypothetical protein NLI96_g5242 [Meripilus lineatus]|uniref:F-box domain-containing protein n=1 Tax=Meripilus lineatus TaxID=2056292 RepID=A0AAD5V5H3_9APHY|nr:hypothetical protein NLI96_g5242 [Physisporinus lineatus]